MRSPLNLIVFCCILFLMQGCYSFYSTKIIDIEIVEPGEVKIPEQYQKVAIRYNNANVSLNPLFSKYNDGNKLVADESNTDSVASKIFYYYFVTELNEHSFFDSVIDIEPCDYSTIKILDTINFSDVIISDTLLGNNDLPGEFFVLLFSKFLRQCPVKKTKYSATKYLDREYGLYNSVQLKNIADSTGADLLASLDYFGAIDGIHLTNNSNLAYETVFIMSYWNFYDLQEQKLKFIFNRTDTITWSENVSTVYEANRYLPPRKDAVLNAADIAGSRFANLLIPHWTKVDRMYYVSGHVELKKTDKLVKEGKWREAAEIWKSQVDNPNKSIAAKSMFNLGVACEMEGDLDAAIDWVIKSFYVFGQKNT
ncbi:MAG: DUF6340 family protein, partial [Bacteroidota bacterium]